MQILDLNYEYIIAFITLMLQLIPDTMNTLLVELNCHYQSKSEIKLVILSNKCSRSTIFISN